jgi:hypothetical protein
MLCVNCDHPLPDGTSACPGCGASRLELRVPAAMEPATLRRRRRGRGWGVLTLLLCAVVVAALAGQASLPSHGAGDGASSDRKPGKGPAAAVVRVALGTVPAGGPDPGTVLAAARTAMQDWAGAGLDLREATDGSADVALEFVLNATDASGQAGTAPVLLGDAACTGSWSAYTHATMEALAARALGQAMGRDGPHRLMDPVQPRYDAACGSQGSLDIPSGQSDGKAFHLGGAAGVGYTMRVQGGQADVCILEPSQWDAFTAGNGNGTACDSAATAAQGSAQLAAGDYILGFLCVAAQPSCAVDYTLSVQPA